VVNTDAILDIPLYLKSYSIAKNSYWIGYTNR